MTRFQFNEVEDTVDEEAQVVEYKELEGDGDIVDKESVTKGEKEAIDEVANVVEYKVLKRIGDFLDKGAQVLEIVDESRVFE